LPTGETAEAHPRCNLCTAAAANVTPELADWLLVYAYIDAHPGVSQAIIMEHFQTRYEGALIFNQSTLFSEALRTPKNGGSC